MKLIIRLLTCSVIVATMSSFGFNKRDKKPRIGELRPNQIVHFGEQVKDPKTYVLKSTNRGSYDSSSYSLLLDPFGNISVYNINGCKGKHQNELELLNCFGTITRSISDTIKIHASTTFRKVFIFCIQQKTVIDSFEGDVDVAIVSRTLDGEVCPVIVNGFDGTFESSMSITALPKNINFKEVFDRKHSDETVGMFSSLVVTDSKGELKQFAPNDYVLIGGNSMYFH